ncbi:Translation initiation factor IF-2 [compost metagenome]
MKGMLDPIFKENVLGHAEVRNVFKITGVGAIAGCMITDGKILRNAEVRLIRAGIVVFEGKIDTLKRFKDDVKEVAQGYECGISLERYHDIKEGDIIEAYVMETVER